MPHYTITLEIARPLPDMFAYFTRPRHLLQFTPPELNLELLSAPDILAMGAQMVWKGRRWGVSQQITQEVSGFQSEKLIVVQQKKGPFGQWIQAHHFESTDGGTRIVEKIDYSAPGGLLGLALTADKIRKDLDAISIYRAAKLRELFV
jgi:ligand-binding SRPBCC domain-containing protein